MQTILVKTASRSLLLQSTDLAEIKEWAILIQKAAILETAPKGQRRMEAETSEDQPDASYSDTSDDDM
jgi:hypothetical protein